MQVRIEGQKVRLDDRHIIGQGGEATVFKHQGAAVKIYQAPSTERDRKLRAMVQQAVHLPSEVITPRRLVFDAQNRQVIGFDMRLLEAEYRDIRQLSSKKYRQTAQTTTREIAQLFLNGHHTLTQIHQAGLVVGDLNDLNLMFRDQEMLFIDVDSFQFDVYPCTVGTEAFLDPALYGIDLSKTRLVFKPENDWYSFAVLLFKSLLLTHPYGGIHPSVKILTKRAQKHISVFDKDVQYPRIAYSPELLTDDLAYEFTQWFENGKRTVFPADILRNYIAQLKECPNCGATYPVNRSQCPMCSAKVPVQISLPMGTGRYVLQTDGNIVAWHVTPTTARVIAYENNKAVYYSIRHQNVVHKTTLFNVLPTARYAFIGDVLVASPALNSDELLILDVSGDKPVPLTKMTTGIFGNTTPVFGTSARSLYRLAGGYLLRGTMQNGQLIEHQVMSIAEGQTWFTVDSQSDRVFGYYRTFDAYQHWLLVDQNRVDVDLPPLEKGEFLIEASVKFASKTVLVLRQTQLNGVERIRIDEVDLKGRHLRAVLTQDVDLFRPLDAHTYAANMILYATDQGVVQERLDTRSTKTFTQTEKMVKRGDALFAYEKGVLVIGEAGILYLSV